MNFRAKVRALGAAAILMTGLAACHGGAPYSGGYFDYYGNYCGNVPYAGCTYFSNSTCSTTS